MVLDLTFFVFDGQFYKQKFETPMGSLLSPIVANLLISYAGFGEQDAGVIGLSCLFLL